MNKSARETAVCIADLMSYASSYGIGVPQLVEQTCRPLRISGASRLYVGSYFCSQYFLGQLCGAWHQAFTYCRRERIPATLVVPVFSRLEFEVAKRMLDVLISDYGDVIDEITVNDARMIGWCSRRYGKRLHAGRLMSKDPAAPRYPDLSPRVHEVRLPAALRKACSEGLVSGFELDPAHEAVDVAAIMRLLPVCTVAVHGPYCHLATASMCKIAKHRAPDASDGRFGDAACGSCALECASCFSESPLADGTALMSWGRSLLFSNEGCRVEGCDDALRTVVTPFDVVLSYDVNARNLQACYHRPVRISRGAHGESERRRAHGASERSEEEEAPWHFPLVS